MSKTDSEYMQEALALAARGGAGVRPNPQVGALVVRDGEIVGRGWHAKAGEPHAEVLALRDAGARARGATIYVTLEPCAHTGRTPACTEALIRAGVARVVYAAADPFPAVSGKGAARLREAGMEVCGGVEAAAARELNRGYFLRWEQERPYVYAKFACSLDGKTATVGGESQWITCEDARLDGHRLRAVTDAVLIGSRTAAADNPRLTVRLPGATRRPLRVVWESRAALSPQSFLVTEMPERTLVLHGAAAPKEHLQRLRAAGVACAELPQTADGLDVRAGLRILATQYDVQYALVEGGSTLLGSFLAADVIDSLYAYIAPLALGGQTAPGAIGGRGIATLAEARRFVLRDCRRIGTDLRCIYERRASCLQD